MAGLLSWVLIAGLAFIAIHRLEPPDAAPTNAPLADFSSGRAMKHLRVIAQRPHPMASTEQAAVRDYILRELAALGIHSEVQSATVVNQRFLTAGTVKNIAARLKGADHGKAVMLAGHYDSVLNGPGAGDNGSAVAAMLETARALKADTPLRNDVIFLFTDGEEVGLLGATAFMVEHPWAKDVGVVFNFEARGSGGPAVMFETSEQNGKLIKELAQAAPHPIANSVANEVYKWMPNDTDLSIFKRGGLPALNFAYFYGLSNYHTPLDTPDHVNERSLQHQGSYALALARRFGNSSLDGIKESDAVYFDLLGLSLIHYPVKWALPMTILVTLLFMCAVWLGLRRKHLTLRQTGFGALAFLSLLVATPLGVILAWHLSRIVCRIMGVSERGHIYNTRLYIMGIVALTIALFSSLFILWERRRPVKELAIGAQLWWLMLLIVLTVWGPASTYLLTWPLLFSLLATCYLFASKNADSESSKSLVFSSIAAIPAVLLIVPLINLISHALALQSIGAVAVLVTLLMGLLMPQLQKVAAPGQWLCPVVSAVGALALIVAGNLRSTPDSARPYTDSLFYSMNVDIGKAVWASNDPEPDEWTSQFLTGGIRIDPLREYVPPRASPFISASAPVIALAAPEANLLDDQKGSGGTRILRLRITSPREAPVVRLVLDSEAKVLQATVNGKSDPQLRGAIPLPPSQKWTMTYWGLPPEGIELTLELTAPGPVKLQVIDQSFGLPVLSEKSFRPRPDHLMAANFPLNDSTLVVKSFIY